MDVHRRATLAALAIFGCAAIAAQPLASASGFADVAGWVAPAVTRLAAAHIVSGFPDGMFHPDWPVTRAEMVVMAFRATHAGSDAGAPDQDPYPDVPLTAWYAGDVAAARSGGWLPFVTGATLAPDQPVTREEAVTILMEALDRAPAPGGDLSRFRDAGQVDPWALGPMVAAVEGGYIHGYPDGTIEPKMPLDRADAAALLAPLGSSVLVVDGHTYRVDQTLRMQATAYNSNEPGVGTTTATDTLARVGEVAVDPSVIPLGSWLWVTGYSTPGLPAGGILEHAEDTGGAIVGNRIDLYVGGSGTASDAFGYQNVQVQVLTLVH
ncbi:MAG TPA: S-layer homology domain-containing protein [Bacillota bacterium]|nr:S-layer homology domain-containing protein [Bacillota bacterium]